MCGIFGASGSLLPDRNHLDSALELLENRGPDDKGSFSSTSVTLGHTRLAIQDVAHGAQPMFSFSKQHVIVFNGEIYNHFELRKLLPMHTWRTKSDTETLVELFERFGVDVTEKLIGMYAFAVWNFNDSELTLARDVWGEKPLYYSLIGGNLAFCSDPRGIHKLPHGENKIEAKELHYFLKYGYVNSTSSTYSSVSMLLPGQILKFQNSAMTLSEQKLENRRDAKATFDGGILRSKLKLATERTLLADQKVGVMLSGGLDSSIIATLAIESFGSLPTFTVSLTKDSEDAKYARELALRINSEHHEIQINPSQLAEQIEEVLSALPQPFGDTAILPTYILSKIARPEVKVLLSGDGADEVFAGYGYYDKYRELRIGKTTKTDSFFKQFRYELSKNSRSKRVNKNREEFKKSLLTSGRATPEFSWHQDLAAFSDSELDKMGKLNTQKIEKGIFGSSGRNSAFWDVIRADRQSYLAGDILRKSDMGGMLASVEIRSPFLDKELTDYILTSSISEKNLNKEILYQSCADIIPLEIYKRRKQGFGVPLDQWFVNPQVDKLVSSTLSKPSSKVYDFFDFEISNSVIRASNLKKWNFFVLAYWLEKHA